MKKIAVTGDSLRERFVKLRIEVLGKTQEEMAKDLGISQTTLSTFESGLRMPSGNFFERVAQRAPEINFNWLIYNEGSPLREGIKAPRQKESAGQQEESRPDTGLRPKKTEYKKSSNPRMNSIYRAQASRLQQAAEPDMNELQGQKAAVSDADRIQKLEDQLRELMTMNYNLMDKIMKK